jgi:hypothetical protein
MNYLINEILYTDDCAIIECVSKKFGKFAVLIDEDNIEKVKKYHWNIKAERKTKNKFYVQSTEKGKTIHLHRYLLDLPSFNGNNCVDHINGNSLDNRKKNLRVCTLKENIQNREKTKNGIKYNNLNGKWEVYQNKILLASFKSINIAKKFLQEYECNIA